MPEIISTGAVTFAAKMPGEILDLRIEPGAGYLVHRHGFIAGTTGIQVSPVIQKIGAGIFGGEGFILQKLEGSATAWVSLSGEMVSIDLNPGESIRVHPGHVGIFQERVRFEITTIKGIRKTALASVYPRQTEYPGQDQLALLLDVGATIRCDALDLAQFAVMGSAYARRVSKVERPRVGLLNMGAEPFKERIHAAR